MVFVSAELSRGRGERRSPAPRVALASASAARSLVPCACSSADRAGLFDLLGLRPLADDELVLHGVTRSRRKPPRRRCRPTSSLGRSDRPLALLWSSLFACSETLLSRFLVASQPVRDLLLCAKHLFVAARTKGCSDYAASATGSASARLGNYLKCREPETSQSRTCQLVALDLRERHYTSPPRGSRWPRHTVPCA